MAAPRKNAWTRLYGWLLDGLYLPLRSVSPVCPASFRERLGLYTPEALRPLASGDNLWLHAASAGEVNAILPLARAFKARHPGAHIVLTTSSATGKRLALERQAADAVFLAPLDMTGPLRRAFRAFRPRLLLIAETEFWPAWLFRARRNQVPTLLVNGRISDKSFPSYQKMRGLFGPALQCFDQCLVQTEGDRDKLAALGVLEGKVRVLGQMKYDLAPPDPAKAAEWGRVLGIREGDAWVVLGSLREGEEDLLFPQLPRLLAGHPGLRILVAPRHVKNAALYQKKLGQMGLTSRLRSEAGEGSPSPVVVLDTVGELSLAYSLARAAFVGGTLVPVGGHNVMEPALSGVPVLFGPHTGNVAEAAEALLSRGGGFRSGDPAQLAARMEGLLDGDVSREAGQKARLAVESLRGATQKILEAVEAYWPGGPAV
ncbi:MAG TPA: glycosyltransferase N-terminal domain-containing protein [bacterium]|nr:glycosyltransferase N-terminal domain-containing protein [bacterium]